MTIRITASRILAATVLAGALASASMIAAAQSYAAPCTGGAIADPVTGVCWSPSSGSNVITGTGGVCLPGRLGLCMAGLQNSQMPGANLPSSGSGSWP